MFFKGSFDTIFNNCNTLKKGVKISLWGFYAHFIEKYFHIKSPVDLN